MPKDSMTEMVCDNMFVSEVISLSSTRATHEAVQQVLENVMVFTRQNRMNSDIISFSLQECSVACKTNLTLTRIYDLTGIYALVIVGAEGRSGVSLRASTL